jgi:PhnB protein
MATSVNPYINFNGNCEEAFTFYKSVFGGEFPYVGRYSDMPPMESGKEMAPEDANKIMHMSLPLGNGSMLLGSDVGGDWAQHSVTGNNVQLSINTDSQEEADKIYNGLAEGGRANMPMSNTFWGSYFGMLTDKYGINWMVSCEPNKGDKQA